MAKVDTSIEAELQKALIAAAEDALKKHGVRINSIYFNWMECTGLSSKGSILMSCELTSAYAKDKS